MYSSEPKKSSPVRLLILADDLTGALDTGVKLSSAAANGDADTERSEMVNVSVTCSCECSLSAVPGETDVLVIDTETRHCSSEKAYQIIYDIVRRASKAGVPHIYILKVV